MVGHPCSPGEEGFEARKTNNMLHMSAMLDISLGSLRRRGVSEDHIVFVCVNTENACGIFSYEEVKVRKLIEESSGLIQGEMPPYRCFALDGRRISLFLEVLRDSPPSAKEMDKHLIRMGQARGAD